ncbi:uncharacterized protein [Nicotiana tomentosiformis]|uniref:uncharacterized protein n=1 Tax=Nicotiana tomentosiformis TaxID=4098 RepID=UPI00388C496B
MEARVRRFVKGLSPLVINEATITALNSNMNYGKMVAFAQGTEDRKLKNRRKRKGSSKARTAGNLGGSSGGSGGSSTFRGGSSGPSQSFTQCGMRGHIQRVAACPARSWAKVQHSQLVFAATISATHLPARSTPTLAGRGTARGGGQSLGGPNGFYAMWRHRDSEASPDVITSILTVQSHDVYALIDPGSTLLYVTPYGAMEFGIESEQLHEAFFVSTPVGESIVAALFYGDFVVTDH